jgi:hypothetical protein
MAKTIKRNIDLIIVVGIGLFLLVGAMINVYEKISVDYVSAATSADITVSATVAESEELTVTLVGSGVAINESTTTVATPDGTHVNFGTLSTVANTIAAHTLTMTTNASSGYTVYIKYNHKLYRTASSSQDIDDLATHTNASPGSFSAANTEAFGYTTEDFTLAGTAARFSGGKWAAFDTSDYEVAYHTGQVSATTTKIGYQAGISGSTTAGTDYGCLVTYTMTSSF